MLNTLLFKWNYRCFEPPQPCFTCGSEEYYRVDTEEGYLVLCKSCYNKFDPVYKQPSNTITLPIIGGIL